MGEARSIGSVSDESHRDGPPTSLAVYATVAVNAIVWLHVFGADTIHCVQILLSQFRVSEPTTQICFHRYYEANRNACRIIAPFISGMLHLDRIPHIIPVRSQMIMRLSHLT